MELIGYERVATAARLAVYSGQHLLLVGPPGTGKSTFARAHFQAYEGKLFSTQLSKWSDETAIFGPPNLRTLREEGTIQYDDTGILAAHYLYVDELFDASDVLLRTLLSVLEERTFTRGNFTKSLPLQSAIATANYTRLNELTEAVLDRFSLNVPAPILTTEQKASLWKTANNPTSQHQEQSEFIVSHSAIQSIRDRAKNVDIPSTLIEICNLWADENNLSPRRRSRIAWLLRVNAALNNRLHVEQEDLSTVLPFCLPPNTGGTQTFDQIEKSIENRLNEKTQASLIQAQLKLETTKTFTSLKNLTQAIRNLKEMVPASQELASQRDKAIQNLQAKHTQLARDLELLP